MLRIIRREVLGRYQQEQLTQLYQEWTMDLSVDVTALHPRSRSDQSMSKYNVH